MSISAKVWTFTHFMHSGRQLSSLGQKPEASYPFLQPKGSCDVSVTVVLCSRSSSCEMPKNTLSTATKISEYQHVEYLLDHINITFSNEN